MKKIVLLLLLFQSTLAFGQDKTYYLEGTLGKSKIYMQINVMESSQPYAIYFYQNSLKDIPLEGSHKNKMFTFIVKHNDTIQERFILKKIVNTNFEGTWSGANGKSFVVRLSPINFDNYKSDLSEDYADEKLNLVKSKFLEFKKQKTTVYNNKGIVWYTEKHCDAPFFRLGDAFSEKSKNIVNPILEIIQIENTLDQLNCSSDYSYNLGGSIEYDTVLTFLNNNLFGFKTASNWFCGGAYPDNGTRGYLIDLNSGKNYEMDNIIAFDKSVTTEKESNFERFVEYRKKYFAPKLFAIVNSDQHFVKPKNTDEEPCDMTDLDIWWGDETWIYTEKGIVFTPSFPHAMRSCEESFLVPFEKLKKYKNPKFPYQF